MRRKIFAVLLMTTLMLGGEIASASLNNWQYLKELPVDGKGFAAIKLDTDIMQNCQDSFTDIRVTDQQGREIASQIIEPGTEEMLQSVSLLNSVDYADYCSVVIYLGEKPRPHNQVELNIRTDKPQDYLREVEILASNDASTWGQLGSGKIFSYNDNESNLIKYPTSTMRYLQINIKKKPDESTLRVAAIQLKFLPENIYSGTLINAPIISRRSDKTTTNLVLDLGVPNYIISEVQIETSDRNFDRAVKLGSSNHADFDSQESQLKFDRIFAYDWNNYLVNNNAIAVDQFCQRYLTISILNEDSPPLNIDAIKIYGNTPTLLADLSGPSVLWYGNPGAVAPSYDLKQFANLITKNDLKTVIPGLQKINPEYKAPVLPWTERNKWILNLAIVMVGGIFVLIIFRKFKQLRDQERQV